jgi:hypothetical protein
MQYSTKLRKCVVSGFRHDVDKICALLPCYVAYSGNFLPTLRDNLSGPIFKGKEIVDLSTTEDGTR